MPVTLLVEVKQQLGVLVPGWVTVWHVYMGAAAAYLGAATVYMGAAAAYMMDKTRIRLNSPQLQAWQKYRK